LPNTEAGSADNIPSTVQTVRTPTTHNVEKPPVLSVLWFSV